MDDTEIDRVLNEECPGPDLESALTEDTLAKVLRDPPLTVESDATLADALRLMREERRGYVLVVADERLAGIFTERDVLMKVAGNPLNVERTPVSAYMTRDPVILPAGASVAFALNRMVVEGFRHVPIVEGGHPIGVVSMRDIIEYLCEHFHGEVLNLPPNPQLTSREPDGA